MKREISNKLNYILDNLIPPIIRDNKLFMGLAMKMVIGSKYKYYMEFKDRLPSLSETEINEYYSLLADTFMKRETDLNDLCIKCIMENIVGTRVLDAASGRGFLANKIAEKQGGCVAMDIVKGNSYNDKVTFIKGSLTNIPFEDNSFDTVICTHAIEHIKDVSVAVEELKRVCEKRLIIVVPRQREYKYTFDLHVNFYPYKFNVQTLLGNGASVKLLDNDWMCIENFMEDVKAI